MAAQHRGKVEVVNVNLARRAQRRLARHAACARMGCFHGALLVDDLVDIDTNGGPQINERISDKRRSDDMAILSSDEEDRREATRRSL
eukprot:4007649-Amphidinium_carterae.1